MATIFDDKLDSEAQFLLETDPELRRQLIIYADGLDEKARLIIERTYADQDLRSYFNGLRNSGICAAKNSKAKNGAHLLVRYPNPEVFVFIETLMKVKYGADWLQDKRVYKEPLVKPWMTSKL